MDMNVGLEELLPLQCDVCGRDLVRTITDECGAIAIYLRRAVVGKAPIEEILCVCKGACDAVTRGGALERGFVGGWEDLLELTLPTLYLRFVVRAMQRLCAEGYTRTALQKEQTLLAAFAPRVFRECSAEERQLAHRLLEGDLPF